MTTVAIAILVIAVRMIHACVRYLNRLQLRLLVRLGSEYDRPGRMHSFAGDDVF